MNTNNNNNVPTIYERDNRVIDVSHLSIGSTRDSAYSQNTDQILGKYKESTDNLLARFKEEFAKSEAPKDSVDAAVLGLKRKMDDLTSLVTISCLRPETTAQSRAAARITLTKDLPILMNSLNISADEAILQLLGESSLEMDAAIDAVQLALVHLISRFAMFDGVLESLAVENSLLRETFLSLDPQTRFKMKRPRESKWKYFFRTGIIQIEGFYHDFGAFLHEWAQDTTKTIALVPLEGLGFPKTAGDLVANMGMVTDNGHFMPVDPDCKLDSLLGQSLNIHTVRTIYLHDPLTCIKVKEASLKPIIDRFFFEAIKVVKYNSNNSEPSSGTLPDTIKVVPYKIGNLVVTMTASAKDGLSMTITNDATSAVIWDPALCYATMGRLKKGNIVPTAGTFLNIPVSFVMSKLPITAREGLNLLTNHIARRIYGEQATLFDIKGLLSKYKFLRSEISKLWSTTKTIV